MKYNSSKSTAFSILLDSSENTKVRKLLIDLFIEQFYIDYLIKFYILHIFL